MPRDFLSMRTLVKTEKQDSYFVPDHFVVVDFDDSFSGRVPEVTPDADMDKVPGRTVPLRFLPEVPEVVYRSSGAERIDRSRAGAARSLLSQYDNLNNCSEGCIPTEIVAPEGNRPAVAMYLYAYHEKSYAEISELMDVNIDTVRRYRRRVRD